MATSDQDVTHSGDAGPGVLVREGSYGTQVFEVEPGGAEFIPLNERHGRPFSFSGPGPRRTWSSPRSSSAFSRSPDSASASGRPCSRSSSAARSAESRRGSCPCGPVRGAADGPRPAGVRLLGDPVPAALNPVTAGIGWFAVNSVSGASALDALTGMPTLLCLVDHVVLQSGSRSWPAPRDLSSGPLPVLAIIFAIGHGADLHQGASEYAGGEAVVAARRIPADARCLVRVCRGLESLRRRLHAIPSRRVRQPARGRLVRRAGSFPVLHHFDGGRCSVGDRSAGDSESGQPDRGLHRALARAGRHHTVGHRARRGRGERARHVLRRARVHLGVKLPLACAARSSRWGSALSGSSWPGAGCTTRVPSTRTSC